jgi:hypothetical protein
MVVVVVAVGGGVQCHVGRGCIPTRLRVRRGGGHRSPTRRGSVGRLGQHLGSLGGASALDIMDVPAVTFFSRGAFPLGNPRIKT